MVNKIAMKRWAPFSKSYSYPDKFTKVNLYEDPVSKFDLQILHRDKFQISSKVKENHTFGVGQLES